MVSTSFETAIRVLTRWEREGLVGTDPDGFTLGDLARLAEIAGAAPAGPPLLSAFEVLAG